MEYGQAVRSGAWILILLNLLMALISIWGFVRMAPAIDQILARNGQSLEACEGMLAVLAMAPEEGKVPEAFSRALEHAEVNVTEHGEMHELELIRTQAPAAFAGDQMARGQLIKALVRLSGINREAMGAASVDARRLCLAGAWAVVFMGVWLFTIGILFKRAFVRNLIAPLDELDRVLVARRNGERMRRCNTSGMHNEVRHVLSGVNELMDENP